MFFTTPISTPTAFKLRKINFWQNVTVHFTYVHCEQNFYNLIQRIKEFISSIYFFIMKTLMADFRLVLNSISLHH